MSSRWRRFLDSGWPMPCLAAAWLAFSLLLWTLAESGSDKSDALIDAAAALFCLGFSLAWLTPWRNK